jgi:hypothetical protein
VGVWSQYQTERDRYEAYQKRADDEAEKSADEIARNCTIIPLVNPALINCLRQQIQAYQKQDTTNKDLEAQQRMAYWAAVAALLSGLGLLVSVGGLILLFRSLRQTRQAISNDREIGEAQVRAYLAVESPEQHLGSIQAGKDFAIELKIKNTGQSPAYNMQYIAALMPLDYPLADDQGDLIEPDPASIQRGVMIGAGGDSRIDAELTRHIRPDEIKSITNEGALRLCAVVIVTYFDVFQRRQHKTKYCAYLTKGVPVLGPTGFVVTKHEWALANVHNEAT